MAAFTEMNLETVLSACSVNVTALAESLGQCLDRAYRLEAGESGIWSPDELATEYCGPGVLALFQVGTQGLAVLIPESLPLPEWYIHPNDSEKARLETLSMEWSMNLLPPDLEVEKYRSLVTDDLARAVGGMAPAEWAPKLELRVFEANQESTDPVAKLLVVWPLEQPNFEIEAAPAPVTKSTLQDFAAAAMLPSAPPQLPPVPRVDPLARLRGLPVQVSVRLAEKKILMSQLLGITPGMLITFNKSCEDLLDLFVNNSRYCRGEAVKIGENFGLKINQVGIKEETPRRVIDA